MTKFLLASLVLLVVAGPPGLSAQSTSVQQASNDESHKQSTRAPASSPTRPQAPEEIQREREIERQEQSQKALGVVPMFGVTSRHNAPPLSSSGKFYLMAKTFLDPFPYVASAFQAGIAQASNSFEGYGQGAEGFGKRYGATLADSASSNFFSNYFYPVLFRQDPRYFRLGEGTKKKRVWHSLEQEFVARQDSGGRNVHWSNILGAFTAGTISNAYYPPSDRGVGLTVSRAVIALGYGSAGNLALEFWPDISHKLFHKRKNEAHPTEPPGTTPK